MSSSGLQLISIGKVSRLHGYQGALVVTTQSGKDSALNSITQIWLGKTPESAQPFQIQSASWMPRGWKLELSQINDEPSAENLLGLTVFANRLDLPPLETNEYYLSDLEQMKVMDWDTKEVIGSFVALEESDVKQNLKASYWLIQTQKGSISVPAVAHFIHQVDTENKIIWLKNLSELA